MALMALAEILRERGSRVTQARQLVWDALESIDGHATVQQILDVVQRRGAAPDSVNQSSVYRTLQLFSELGLVRESRTDATGSATWEVRHSDTAIHLICESCGAVIHHESAMVEALGSELARAGFAASTVDVQVTGLCRDCVR